MICGLAAAVIVVVVDIAFLFGAAVGFSLDFIVHGLLRIIMVSGHSGMDSDISISYITTNTFRIYNKGYQILKFNLKIFN